MRNGTHEKRMFGLAVNDALKDVVFLDAYRHKEKLRREFTLLSRTKSPLLALLFLGQAPIPCHDLQQVVKVDLKAKFDVNVQASVGVVVYVPEDISTVSRLPEIDAQVGSMFPSMQSERGEEGLVVAEGALEVREPLLEYFSRSRHVVVDIGLEGRARHWAVHGLRLQESSKNPGLVRVARSDRADFLQSSCLT